MVIKMLRWAFLVLILLVKGKDSSFSGGNKFLESGTRFQKGIQPFSPDLNTLHFHKKSKSFVPDNYFKHDSFSPKISKLLNKSSNFSIPISQNESEEEEDLVPVFPIQLPFNSSLTYKYNYADDRRRNHNFKTDFSKIILPFRGENLRDSGNYLEDQDAQSSSLLNTLDSVEEESFLIKEMANLELQKESIFRSNQSNSFPSSLEEVEMDNYQTFLKSGDLRGSGRGRGNDLNFDPDLDLRDLPKKKKRPRRSVVHLYDMVVCATGCNPLAYKGYGCYCGFLGSGLTVDGIDRCCAKHDWCYHHAKCPPLLTYFVPYYWTCNDGRPRCVTEYRGWKGVCGANLCECDRQFAECLRKFPCPRSRAMCLSSPWRLWQNLIMFPRRTVTLHRHHFY